MRRRRLRRRFALGATLTGLAAAGAATGALTTGTPTTGGSTDPAVSPTEPVAAGVETATVERRTLSEEDTFDGELAFAGSLALVGHLAGTVTAAAAPGATLRRGDVVARVDERPVVLMYGSRPAWRRLAIGSEGADVEALERNLAALGFDPDSEMDVDAEYTSATAAAVRRWQEDLGVTEDGVVELGEVLFAPGPRRVVSRAVEPGRAAPAGDVLLETTSLRRVVELDVDARSVGELAVGTAVRVVLPDERSLRGTVIDVGEVATRSEDPQGGDEPTVAVEIGLRGRAGGLYDSAPVEVVVERVVAADVLAVPVRALLALASGGYGVEVVTAGGATIVPVELGAFADGWVEVSGDGLTEGATVTAAA